MAKLGIFGIAVVSVAFLHSYWLPEDNIAQLIVEEPEAEYDYVVIGSGSAGSVVATRLSEDPGRSVLMLEAGDYTRYDRTTDVPAYGFLAVANDDYDWQYKMKPHKDFFLSMVDNRLTLSRGRVLGGSNAINGLMWCRSSHFDYDEWAEKGCKGWSYKDVLPYFRKLEAVDGHDVPLTDAHGQGGPISIVEPMKNGEFTKMIINAGKEMGLNHTDLNNGVNDGIETLQSSQRNGVRSGVRTEYLNKVKNRSNLHISVNSYVVKIDIDKDTMTTKGVYFIKNGRKRYVAVRNEVILSSGSIGSPHLLMLSGVGHKDHLEEHGIPVVKNLPGVGQNLQEHPAVMMNAIVKTPATYNAETFSSWKTRVEYALFGTGPLANGGVSTVAYVRTNSNPKESTYTDIQLLTFSTVLNAMFKMKPEFEQEAITQFLNKNTFTTLVTLSHPKSRGSVQLTSSDPFDLPIVDHFPDVTTNGDLEHMVKAVKIWLQFMETDTMKKHGVDLAPTKLSFCSTHGYGTDEYWRCFVKHMAMLHAHSVGSCKMGSSTDSSAVVDSNLKVIGVEGLRVVDSSVIPQMTTGNTNSVVMMVAEKASDIIRGVDTVKHLR